MIYSKREIAKFAIAVFCCASILLPTFFYIQHIDTGFVTSGENGEKVSESSQNLRGNPRFNRGGELPFFHFDYLLFGVIPMYYIIGPAGLITNIGRHLVPSCVLILLCLVFLFTVNNPFSEFRREFLIFFLTGILLYLISWSSAFLFSKFVLYNPSRYIRFVFYITSSFFLSANYNKFVGAVWSWRRKLFFLLILVGSLGLISSALVSPSFLAERFSADGVIDQYKVSIIQQARCALLFASLGIFIISVIRIMKYQLGKNILYVLVSLSLCLVSIPLFHVGPGATTIPENDRKLCQFLSRLPKNIKVAGHPRDMDNIPILCKRSVLVNSQLSQEFEDNVGRRMIYDFFKAYYSDSMNQVYDFCSKYRVDYLIVNENHFSRSYLSKGDFFDEPYNRFVNQITKNRKEFCLSRLHALRKVYIANNQFVIRCEWLFDSRRE